MVKSENHFDAGNGWPRTRAGVLTLSNEELTDLVMLCNVESVDPDNCLACFAYITLIERDQHGVPCSTK